MKRNLWNAFVLLAVAALAAGARPASAQSPCTNPYTGDVYNTATDAVNGFCGHVDFFRRTTGATATSGFISLTCENGLCSAAVNALNACSASQFTKLELQLLMILGSPVSASGTPLVTLPIFGPPLTTDPTTLPQESGPIVSNCFIKANCPLAFVSGSCAGTFATQCDSCEQERRLIARTLAFDMLCAAQLVNAGACP